jgi:hypothetical protein
MTKTAKAKENTKPVRQLDREIANLLKDDPMSVTLVGPGRNPAIGPEKGKATINGIAKFTSPYGSVRYLYYVDGVAASALQVVSQDGEHAIIANVYTALAHRRKSLARKLLDRAKKDFSVEHAKEHSLSDEGRAWRDEVDEARSR